MEREEKLLHRRGFLVSAAYWAAIIAIVYFILKYFIRLIMPFFIAAIFAALSRPLARLLSRSERTVRQPDGSLAAVPAKLRMNREVAGVLSVLVLYILIAGLLTVLGVSLVDAVADIVEDVPAIYYDSILPGLERMLTEMEELASRVDNRVLEAVQSAAPDILATIGTKVTEFSARVLVWVSGLAGRLPGILLNGLICLIATVFIAVDFDAITGFFRRNLAEKTLDLVIGVKNSFLDVIWKFVRSYFYIFLITAAEITVGLLLIGQPRPLLIGIIIAVFDAFPIVGSGMVLLPWAVLTLIMGSVGKGLGLLALYLTVVIVRQIIEPRIVGKHVGLRPIVTLLCMYVGTKLFGGLGLFGLPIAAAIIADMNDDGILHFFRRSDTEAV